MLIRNGSTYHLPDGTAVIARAAELGGAIRFEDLSGAPVYQLLPNEPHFYRLTLNLEQGAYQATRCVLTIADLTPEPPSENTDLFEGDEEDRPLCPKCESPMRLIIESLLSDVYRCPKCGTVEEI